MSPRSKIRKIMIYWDDGTHLDLDENFISKLIELDDALDLMQRAQYVFNQLKPLFEVKKD